MGFVSAPSLSRKGTKYKVWRRDPADFTEKVTLEQVLSYEEEFAKQRCQRRKSILGKGAQSLHWPGLPKSRESPQVCGAFAGPPVGSTI